MLLIIFFFYLSFTYIYKKNYFLVDIAFGIILLDLIGYISNSYYIKKTHDLIKNTSYYKNLENIYYKKGSIYLLIMLATNIHDFTINHFILNMHNIVIFNCICIYHVFFCEDVLNIWLIVWHVHTLFYLLLLIVTILTHITIINPKLSKNHPILYIFAIIACISLIFLSIYLSIELCGIIYRLIDYILHMDEYSGNKGSGQASGGYDTGPYDGPGNGPGGENPGPSSAIDPEQNKKSNKKRVRTNEYNEKQKLKSKERRANMSLEDKIIEQNKNNEIKRNRAQEEKDKQNERDRIKRSLLTDEEREIENEKDRIWKRNNPLTREQKDIKNKRDRERKANMSLEDKIIKQDKDNKRKRNIPQEEKDKQNERDRIKRSLLTDEQREIYNEKQRKRRAIKKEEKEK